MKQTLAYKMKHSQTLLEMRSRWRRRYDEADTFMVGFLLGLLGFLGGMYLFLPFARLVPPFNSLFRNAPAPVWAVLFIVFGVVQMITVSLPDEGASIRHRIYVAYLTFFVWTFLTCATVATWLIQYRHGETIYGFALVIYPGLAFAGWWKANRLMRIERQNRGERREENVHLRNLETATRERGNGMEQRPLAGAASVAAREVR